MAQDNSKKVFDLLKQLHAEGAKVKSGNKTGSELTSAALASEAMKPEFDAWVSWTKSF